MPVSSAQGRVGTTDGANRCRDLNARATMVVTPQQYHYACEAFIGYELHRFQIIVAEVFEYMIATYSTGSSHLSSCALALRFYRTSCVLNASKRRLRLVIIVATRNPWLIAFTSVRSEVAEYL